MFSKYLRSKALSSFTHKSKGKYICFIFFIEFFRCVESGKQ